MEGLSIDRSRALTALSAASVRVANVVEAIPDPRAPTKGLEWTLGQTAAHVLSDIKNHRLWLRGEGAVDYGIPDLAERNRRNLDAVPERHPEELAASIRNESEGYVRDALDQPAGNTVRAEVGPALTVEEMTCVLLGELVVHGFDLAGSIGRDWPIDRGDANLIALGSLAILPQFLDRDAAARANASYELRLRGGPRAIIRIASGALTVEPADRRAKVDAHISADPAAFLLVGYGRGSQLGPIVRGKILAWGRKPWAALRFGSYLRNP